MGRHKSTTPKDPRIVYSNQEIEVEGNKVFFDGKYNPENKTLKVYKYRGDIHLAEQAFIEFAASSRLDIQKIIPVHSR